MNNVKCKTENMAVRDYCLIWGCPGLLILTISLFVSLKVGDDFGQDNFAKFVTFIISSGLLGTVYFLFQSVLSEVPLRLHKKPSKETKFLTYQVVETVTGESIGSTSVEQVQECSEDELLSASEEMPLQAEYVQAPLSYEQKEPTAEVPDSTDMSSEQSDLYAQRCKEYQREQEQRRQNDNEELEKLLDAIRKWADDWQHIPVPIRLKSTLTTLDLRHFVWNIAERLGSKKDYTGEVRAIFIKRMFPDVMRDIELDSIRNFKFQPDTGSIVIDEPDKGDYHFHFE